MQFDEGKHKRVGAALADGAAVAKITDFGLSRRMAREAHASNVLQVWLQFELPMPIVAWIVIHLVQKWVVRA